MVGLKPEPEFLEQFSVLASEIRAPLQSPENAVFVRQSEADRMLAVAVRQALDEIGYWPLRKLEVQVDAGFVTLRGIVPSYHLKQLAQSATKGVAGVAQIVNAVEVANCR
jgi:osmotically-inducible protein OsmY